MWCPRDDTRLVLVYYNHLWEPLVGPAARLGLKLDNPTQNWLSAGDIRGLLHLAGFEPVKSGLRMPCPKYVPGLAPLANDVLGRLPLLERLGFVRFVVARPNVPLSRPPNAYSATVAVPCKNEEGNVAAIPARVPEMGAFTELASRSGSRSARWRRNSAVRCTSATSTTTHSATTSRLRSVLGSLPARADCDVTAKAAAASRRPAG